MSEITQVPIHKVVPGINDREAFKERKLRELAESIAENGLAQPPTLRPIVQIGDTRYAVADKATHDIWNRLDSGRAISENRTVTFTLNGLAVEVSGSDLQSAQAFYEIVAGERRTRAMRDILEWTEIPAIVRDLDDITASAIMLAENTSREDLNVIEEALAYKKRMDELGWDARKIGEVAGRNPDLVKRRVELLSLVEEAQHLLRHNNFPIGHAQAMVDLEPNFQRVALQAYKDGMKKTQFQGICNELLEKQRQQTMFDMDELVLQMQSVEFIAVRSGKEAVTSAPMDTDLPPVRFKATDGAGDIFERYMFDLQSQGLEREAAAIGNLYRTLVCHNWSTLPAEPYFPPQPGCKTLREEAHEEKISKS